MIKDPMVCYGETVKNSNSGRSSSGSYSSSRPTVLSQPSNNSSGASSSNSGGEPSGHNGTTSSGGDKDAAGVALPADPGSADGSGTRTAVIIGATVGAAILAFLATVVVIGWRRRHQRRCAKPDPVTNAESTSVDSGGDHKRQIDAAVIITEGAAAVAGTAVCEVPTATSLNIAGGVAAPITHKTPAASNIPLNVTLVHLRLQQPTSNGIHSSSSAGTVSPAAAVSPGDLLLAEPAAQEGRQQVTLRVIGGAKATAAAGLEVIHEHAPLQGPNGDDIVAVAASGGGGGGGGNAAIQHAAGDVGGRSVLHHQNLSFPPLPRVDIGTDEAVMVPEGCCTSSYDFLPSDSSESGSGEGNAMVGLLPVVLGKGTFGRVVEGRYKGRRVAVKLMANEEPWTDLPASSFDRAFSQEMEVLSRCTHPNVVRLLAARVTPPRLCLVMELMDTSLEWLIHHNAYQPEMPMPKVLHIGICVANALAYLHPTIVHRDLKPSNVLVNNPHSDKPIIKLTDFGLSRLRITVGSTDHPDAGTPAYMAPECFDVSNRYIMHQADIFSLGVLIWEMLAMTRPWKETGPVAVAFMVAYKGVRPPLTCLSDSRCPPKLARLLKACWARDPEQRPAAAEVAKELTLVLQNVERQVRES
ncbi:hypothetical protein Vafri_13124 [Volvox africanus]|nr:hypothetical protein Vafri_13124 [Volvox africanus]